MINHHAVTTGRHSFFAGELNKRGHTVLLFAASFEHNQFQETIDYPDGKKHLKKDDRRGFERVWIKTPHYSRNNSKRVINQLVFAYRTILVGMKINEKQPDIIIGSSVHLFAVLAAYILAVKYKVPFIFEVRDLWPQTLIDIGALAERSPITYLFRIIERFLYKKADCIISLLPKAQDYIASLNIDCKKVVYIPNGIDLKWFDTNLEKPDLGDELITLFKDTLRDKMVFSYTGAIGIANGLDTVIDAAKLLTSSLKIHILVVGAGPEKERLLTRVETEGIKKVSFVESVEKDLVPYILSNSDVCILIAKKSKVHRYGVSMNKIFDYLASRKPIISALDTNVNIIEEANCGLFVTPDNPEALAQAVLEMVNLSTEERKRLGYNGRRYVEEHHEISILTDRLLAVIENLTVGMNK